MSRDSLEELEDWINEIALDYSTEPVDVVPEPLGFMTVYDDNGRPFHGNIFEDREVADNAMEIMRQSMKPLFRVNVYPKLASRNPSSRFVN